METDHVKKGSILGGILLIAGCCIGAGMLGLPVLSANAGFKPSIFSFIICWLFMLSTGLLVLEVNLAVGKGSNIVSMAERTLGQVGKWTSWLVFLFLFYSLMVAYLTAGGTLLVDFIQQIFGVALHSNIGSIIFCLLFGATIYLGTLAVDWLNRALMLGLVLSYSLLIFMGSPYIKDSLLQRTNWTQIIQVIPAAILSFGFHNLVPSMTTYLKGNVKALKWTFVIGSAIPLFIYLAWEWLILGIVPLQEFTQALDQGEIATQALKNVVGASWITDVAQIFAFFAIVTSLLGVALSFVDFLADGLKIEKTGLGKAKLINLVLVPPLIFAFFYPTIFLTALNYAGGIGAVILFGILPALMVWKGRYYQHYFVKPIVPGGKPVLVLIILFAGWVMSTLV